MRFLIGICTGAVLTLFIATAIDAPTSPVLARASHQLAAGWTQLIETTSDSLFQGQPPANQDKANPDRIRPGDFDKVANALSQVIESVSEEAVELAEDVAGTAEDVAETAETVAETAGTVAGTAGAVAATAPDASPLQDPTGAPEPGPEPGFDSADWLLLANAPAAVWEPFHSQRSAEGFADRLSRELEHPFRVQREGPGSYQVVFDAQSSMERAELLIQIAEITGQ